MNVTPRNLEFLRMLRQFKFVTVKQLRRWCVPNDKDGSVTREVLRKMERAGLARRFRAEVNNPFVTPGSTVWTPTESGCCLLATKTGDSSLLLDAMPNTHNWTSFGHYVQCGDLMHNIIAAFKSQNYATMGPWFFEHDVISDAKEPEKRFRLYTLIRDEGGKRTVCVPDCAFEVIVGEYRRAYYIELERGTDTPKRVAAKKSPGYLGMDQHFKRHFPNAHDWRVLFVWPNAALRDAARRAVDIAKTQMWLFAALPDITESFLHEPVIYTSQEGPRPFVKPPPVTTPLLYKEAE